jgi:hypothetical protein
MRKAKNILRSFIREEVWRTVSRSAGLVGGADLGGIARSGRPMWSLGTEPHEDEEPSEPYDVGEPEIEDDIEIEEYPSGEPALIQKGKKRIS